MTDKQWVSELHRMVHSDAWPLLREWWQRELMERVMSATDPLADVIEAGNDYRGGLALLLAIENEVTTNSEAVHAKTRASGRGNTPRTATPSNGAA